MIPLGDALAWVAMGAFIGFVAAMVVIERHAPPRSATPQAPKQYTPTPPLLRSVVARPQITFEGLDGWTTVAASDFARIEDWSHADWLVIDEVVWSRDAQRGERW